MKIEKMINIKFTEHEIKEAILNWLEKNISQTYYNHVRDNLNDSCTDTEDGQIVLVVNGAMKEDPNDS